MSNAQTQAEKKKKMLNNKHIVNIKKYEEIYLKNNQEKFNSFLAQGLYIKGYKNYDSTR